LCLIGFIEIEKYSDLQMVETRLHKQFHKDRHHGEWFTSSKEILEYAKTNATHVLGTELNAVLSKIYKTIPQKTPCIDLKRGSVISEIYWFVTSHPDTTETMISHELCLCISTTRKHTAKLRGAGLIPKIPK